MLTVGPLHDRIFPRASVQIVAASSAMEYVVVRTAIQSIPQRAAEQLIVPGVSVQRDSAARDFAGIQKVLRTTAVHSEIASERIVNKQNIAPIH